MKFFSSHMIGIVLFSTGLSGCVTAGNIQQAQDQLDQKVKTGDFEVSPSAAVQKYSGTCVQLEPSKVGSYSFTPQDRVILQKEVNGIKSYSYFKVFCGEWNSKKFLDISMIGSHAGGGVTKAFMVIPVVFLFDESYHQVAESSSFVRLNQGAFQFGEIQESWTFSSNNLKTKKFFLVVEADNKSPIDAPRGHTAQGVPFYPYPLGEFKISFKSTEQ